MITEHILLSTEGFCDIHDLTETVQQYVLDSRLRDGMVLVFVPGSTAAITTIEYEPGLKKDLPELLDRIIPRGKPYHHDATWGDGNGFSHLRAALIGPSLCVPFKADTLLLGTWQQIVLIDFDNRPRQRTVIVQIMGES